MSKIFSSEDGNLNSSIRGVKNRDYSDVDLSLDARTSTDGDVYKKTDAASVKQAVKNLLLTNRFEKPYRPNYGANLSSILFELGDENIGEDIIDAITSSIERFEPRAKVLAVDITATPNYNTVTATVEFRVVATGVVETLKISLNPSSYDSQIPMLPLETSPIVPSDNIIRTQMAQRIAAYNGDLIRRNLVIPPDDALLTDPDEDMIFALFNGFVEGVLLIDSELFDGILTVPDEDRILTQLGNNYLLP